MLMNKIKFWLMNNPFRALSQRFEVKTSRKILTYPYEEMYTRTNFFRKLESTGFKVFRKYKNRYWFSFITKK